MTKNTVDSSFIGEFKVGDNIKFNTELLCDLYRLTDSQSEISFRKAKIIFNVSLIDATYYDLSVRIRNHTREFKYLSDDCRLAIRLSTAHRFTKLIEHFTSHSVFGEVTDYYQSVDKLRELRNRVHIQNKQGDFEANEEDAFTEKRLKFSERITEYTLKYASLNFPRDCKYVEDFELPWAPFYTADGNQLEETPPWEQNFVTLEEAFG